jgi:hypothetical protein
MSAIIIRPAIFPACHASKHAPTLRQRRVATAQVLANAEAEEGDALQRMMAAHASAFPAEHLGVRLIWDDEQGRHRREACDPIRRGDAAQIVRLSNPR